MFKLKMWPLLAVMMLLAALILPGYGVLAQGGGEDEQPFETMADLRAAVEEAVESGDVEPFWDQIVEGGRMPLIFDDTVVFFYRGEAESVSWRMGGGPQWQFPLGDGVRLGETDLWILGGPLPLDARIDYQIILDGREAIIDPINPLRQGDYSVVQMPDYAPPQEIIPRDDIEHGTLTEPITLESDILQAPIPYWVYTPAGYDDLDDLPVIYATDGGGYIEAGFMPTVLDNMIADGLIEPVIAVFVDPVDARTGGNLRGMWFGTPRYADFFVEELIPTIDAEYDTDPSPDARAILGLSLGGYNSVYFAANYHDTFHLIGVQSPVFSPDPSISERFPELEGEPLRFFVHQGVLFELDVPGTRELADVVEEAGFDLRFVETNDGHSWGNWNGLIDDILLFFFGVDEVEES